MDVFSELRKIIKRELKSSVIKVTFLFGFICVFILLTDIKNWWCIIPVIFDLIVFVLKRNNGEKLLLKFKNGEYTLEKCIIENKSYYTNLYAAPSLIVETERKKRYEDIAYVSYKKFNIGDEVLAIHFSFGKNWLNEEKGVTYLLPVNCEKK